MREQDYVDTRTMIVKVEHSLFLNLIINYLEWQFVNVGTNLSN